MTTPSPACFGAPHGAYHTSVDTGRDYSNPGPQVALKQRRAREVDMLRSASSHVARTLPKDLKPDYTRWDKSTRDRLAGAAATASRLDSSRSRSRPATAAAAASLSRTMHRTVALRAAEQRHTRKNLILKQMFTAGNASNVSENGLKAAEQFYKFARPWQGQPSIAYPSRTTPAGTRFRK